MDPTELLSLLDRAAAGIDALLPPVAGRARELTVELQALGRRSAERADQVGAKAAAAVDFERVRSLVTRGLVRDRAFRTSPGGSTRRPASPPGGHCV